MPPGIASRRPAATICSALERKLREHGRRTLSVELLSPDDADPLLARVVDPGGAVVLSISVNRETGLIRDIC